jgi:serine/threonine-protein kinase
MTEAPRSIRAQRQTVPENVEGAVLQALEKLPADRFGTAAAFADALGQPGFTRTTSTRAALASRVMPWKTIALGLGVVVVGLGAGLALLSAKGKAETAPQPIIKFEVPVPDTIPVDLVSVTPDGKRLLVQGTSRSYLYSFADMQWRPLPIPELKGFLSTSLSPDGRWVAFLDDQRTLRVASIDGGATRTLANQVGPIRWERDGFIYLSRTEAGRSRIARLRPEGGSLEELVLASDSTQGLGVGPLLPGGELIYNSGNRSNDREFSTFVLERPGGKHQPLGLPTGFWVMSYVPSGHLLLYGRDAVYAVGFDAKTLKVIGGPIKITASLPTNADYQAGIFAHPATPPGGLALFDRLGRRRELPGAIVPGAWGFGPRVSGSGNAIAFWRYQTPADRWDVFTYRMPAGPVTRISSDSGGRMASWSADDKEIRFVGSSSGPGRLLSGQWDGSTLPQELLTPPGGVGQSSALPDGKRLVIESPNRGLVLVTLGGSDSGTILVPRNLEPRFPRVSPDGRWLAYSAVELGRREVFVRPLDGSASRWQVSRNGGNNPVWARSGRELFFYINDTIRVAGLGPGPGFQSGEPRPLFRVDFLPDYSGFDVLPGDSLFVLHATSATERERITVTVNFLQELRSLKPVALGQGSP